MIIKDINKRVLAIGDNVYFTFYAHDTIKQGIISKIDNKNIFVDYEYSGITKTCRMQHRRAQHRIVRI